MNRIHERLQSENATLAVLGLALLAQVPHAAHVFYVIAPHQGLFMHALSYMYAIALESATLLFVVRGRQNVAWGFAAGSVLVNLCYYAMPGFTRAEAFPVLLISVMLPAAIALYSHDIAGNHHTSHIPDEDEEEVKEEIVTPDIGTQFAEYRNLQSKNEKVQAALAMHLDFNLQNGEIADILGVSESSVSRYLKEVRNGEHT